MRPFQEGRPASAAGNFDQLTATRTMSLLAASVTVPAVMEGPISRTRSFSEDGPRLLAMVASIPALASLRAKAEPIAPDPIIPMVLVMVCSFQVLDVWMIARSAQRALIWRISEPMSVTPQWSVI